MSLASVTDAERLEAPRRIFRRNKRTARTITLELEEGREQQGREGLIAMAAKIGPLVRIAGELSSALTAGANKLNELAPEVNE